MDNTRLVQRTSSAICAAALMGACGMSFANMAPVDNYAAKPSSSYPGIDDERIFVRGVFKIEDDDEVLLAQADYDAEHALVTDPVIFYST